MNFLKKQRASFYLAAAVVVFALVSLIIYCINGSAKYFAAYTGINTSVVILTIFAIALVIGSLVLLQFSRNSKLLQILMDVCIFAAAVLLAAAVFVFLYDRVEPMAIVFSSELESDNAAAWSAMTGSVVGVAFYLITVILTVVVSFSTLANKD